MKLPQISGKDLIKKLCRLGFTVTRQKGSHIRLERGSGTDTIKLTVPLHENLKKGTLTRIIKDAKFTPEEFFKS